MRPEECYHDGRKAYKEKSNREFCISRCTKRKDGKADAIHQSYYINIFSGACTASGQPEGTGSVFFTIWFSLLLCCGGLQSIRRQEKLVSTFFSKASDNSRKMAQNSSKSCIACFNLPVCRAPALKRWHCRYFRSVEGEQ